MKQNTKANSVSRTGITWPSKDATVIQYILFLTRIRRLLDISI